MVTKTYLPRRAALLENFDGAIQRVEKNLVARYGEVEAHSLAMEARREYEILIPEIPYIGEHNPMRDFFLFPASRYLGIYRAFQAHGKSVEQVGRLIYEIASKEIQSLPGYMRFGIRAIWFSGWFRRRLQQRAEILLERKYQDDYLIIFLEGDGRDFDYGVDYLQCASCEFYRQQDAAELAPYVCAIDRIASQELGWGLRRTSTLAEGGTCCDFRFKKGGLTRVEVPAALGMV
jgi:hypothetical protein